VEWGSPSGGGGATAPVGFLRERLLSSRDRARADRWRWEVSRQPDKADNVADLLRGQPVDVIDQHHDPLAELAEGGVSSSRSFLRAPWLLVSQSAGGEPSLRLCDGDERATSALPE